MTWADRPLDEVLRAARPKWTSREVAAARDKLEQAGIENAEQLLMSLDAHLKSSLNVRLKLLGLKTFAAGTITALKTLLTQDSDDELAVSEAKRRSARSTPPLLARHCNVSILEERIVSESTHNGWGVLVFRAPNDFRVSVKLSHRASPLPGMNVSAHSEQWHHYLLIGLVRHDTPIETVACTDEPWQFGTWVAPGYAPIQVWNAYRRPSDPIREQHLPTRAQAGETIHLERCRGVISCALNDQPPVPLGPKALELCRTEQHRLPCLLLGPRTEVRVFIEFGRQPTPSREEEERRAEAPADRREAAAAPEVQEGAEDAPSAPAPGPAPRAPGEAEAAEAAAEGRRPAAPAPDPHAPGKPGDAEDGGSEEETKSDSGEDEDEDDGGGMAFSPISGSPESPSQWAVTLSDEEDGEGESSGSGNGHGHENRKELKKRFSVSDLIKRFDKKPSFG